MGGLARTSPFRARRPPPRGCGSGGLVQSESDQTAIVAAITTNIQLAEAPGNILLPGRAVGLPRDSVVNVSQLLTLDRSYLTEHAGTLPSRLQHSVDEGLRLVLQL